MLGISFFKCPKPRQFNYKPLYYDPKKEEWEEKKRRVLGEEALADEDKKQEKYVPGSYIQKARLNRITAEPEKKQKQNTFIIRFIIVLALLFIIAYFIINSQWLDAWLEYTLSTSVGQ